jgi:hypothetical protein
MKRRGTPLLFISSSPHAAGPRWLLSIRDAPSAAGRRHPLAGLSAPPPENTAGEHCPAEGQRRSCGTEPVSGPGQGAEAKAVLERRPRARPVRQPKLCRRLRAFRAIGSEGGNFVPRRSGSKSVAVDGLEAGHARQWLDHAGVRQGVCGRAHPFPPEPWPDEKTPRTGRGTHTGAFAGMPTAIGGCGGTR